MRVLIFGTIPPPFGGVASSVKNLQLSLEAVGSVPRLIELRCLTSKWDIAHVHYTKPFKKLMGVVLGRILAKKTVCTIHNGRIEAFGLIDNLAADLCHRVIVLNKKSYDAGRKLKWGHKVTIQSNFYAEGLSDKSGANDIILEPEFKHAMAYVSVKWEHNGKDVYGIDWLLANLDALPSQWKLIVVDPKGEYSISDEDYGGRVIHIGKPIDFISLLRRIDLYIRPTSTDGNSIAIQEALVIGVPVLASDAVDRPGATLIYKYGDRAHFKKMIGLVGETRMNADKLPSISVYLEECERLIN